MLFNTVCMRSMVKYLTFLKAKLHRSSAFWSGIQFWSERLATDAFRMTTSVHRRFCLIACKAHHMLEKNKELSEIMILKRFINNVNH